MKKEKIEVLKKEFSPEEVAEALYVINKKAKEIQDKINDGYEDYKGFMAIEDLKESK